MTLVPSVGDGFDALATDGNASALMDISAGGTQVTSVAYLCSGAACAVAAYGSNRKPTPR